MRLKSRLLCLGVALLASAPLVSGAAVKDKRPAVWSPPAQATAAQARVDVPASRGSRTAYSVTRVVAAPTAVTNPVPNDQCSGAITIPCGNISLSGDTFNATNDYGFQDTTKSCTGYSANGRDVVYKLDAQAGDSLWVDYNSLADASIYIVTDCSHVQDSCVAGIDATRQGETEHLGYRFMRTTTYYLILDNFGPDTYGTWTMVGQYLGCGLTLPPNDKCDTATQLYCGTASFSGSTQTANNDYSFPSAGSSCAGTSLAQGRDIAYKMVVNAGDSLSATYTSSANAVAYLVSDCSNPSGTCLTGVNATGTGGTETLRFRFIFTGTYYLILDSDGSNTFGNWSLIATLVCPQAPSNDLCAGATPLPCGTIQLTGSTKFANNDYALPDTGCTGFATSGPDVVYRIDAPPGASLSVDYRFPPPNPGDPTTAPDASIYIVKNCADPLHTCVIGRDQTASGETEHLQYKFVQPGTYYLILDSYEPNFGGDWVLVGSLSCYGAADVDGEPAASFRLGSPSPNPFARNSTVRFSLPARSRAVLRVYDITGRVVRTLVEGDLEAGEHTVTWDARDDANARVRAGTYYARLVNGDRAAHRTLIFVR